MDVYSILRKKASFLIMDQTLLPLEEKQIEIRDHRQMIEAIKALRIRGAPAIGIAGAGACWMAAIEYEKEDQFKEKLLQAVAEIESSRPTAVNLFNATARVREIIAITQEEKLVQTLHEYVDSLFHYEYEACNDMAENGFKAIPSHINTFLTHCNTGGLATYGIGTALGVLRRIAKDRAITVFADETRPLLQGARLTMWELQKSHIDAFLISDNMAAHTIKTKGIQCIVTGADRICKNGDSANKIGTFNLAILARHFNIPFYIVAPESTIDRACPHGDQICIEERAPEEVTSLKGIQTAPLDSKAFNPAFDVTPGELITAIITERAIYEQPYCF